MMKLLKPIALLVIDVQQEMFEKSTPVFRAESLIQNLITLAQAARKAGAPVFYIQHSAEKYLVYGSPGWQFHPALLVFSPDYTIHKVNSNSFEGTSLDSMLRSCGVKTLVVSGMVTHGCVKNTCLGGLAAGYQVILAEDAHSSYSQKAATLIEEWHEKLAKQGVLLVKTAEIEF